MIKISSSQYVCYLFGLCFLASGAGIWLLPLILPAKLALEIVLIWFAKRLLAQYVFLSTAASIVAIDYDEKAGWKITQKDKKQMRVCLSLKTIVSANWMFLQFCHQSSHKMFRVVLASDSVCGKDWSLLHMLVRFASPAE